MSKSVLPVHCILISLLVPVAVWAQTPDVELTTRLQTEAAQTPEMHADIDHQLGPLVLTRPIEAETVQLMLAEAETQYRHGNPAQALQGFESIVAVAPRVAKAWLRIGNLHQQAERLLPALKAYRHAAESKDAQDPQSPLKALTNMLLIHLDGAERALDSLERGVLVVGTDPDKGTALPSTTWRPDLPVLGRRVGRLQARSAARLRRPKASANPFGSP